MREIRIIALGNLKEEYLRRAYEEYAKRLKGVCNLTLEEIKEFYLPENPSEGDIKRALGEEAKIIIKKASGENVISLCVEGKGVSSEEFGKMILKYTDMGRLNFVIGSSFGLDISIKDLSKEKISLSNMTFTHQMSRVILSEQIYRGFSIVNGGKYHK